QPGRWRELDAAAARVRRVARAALAATAARLAQGRACDHAAGAEGRTDGVDTMTDASARALRVGLMVPANNTTMEGELAAWLPAGSTVMTVKIPRGPGLLTPETIPAYRGSAIALARQHFDRTRIDLIAYGCTAAGFISGPEGDAALSRQLS